MIAQPGTSKSVPTRIVPVGFGLRKPNPRLTKPAGSVASLGWSPLPPKGQPSVLASFTPAGPDQQSWPRKKGNYSTGHSTVHSGTSSTMIVFHPYIDVYVCLRPCYILVNIYFLGHQPVWYYMKKPICLIASLAFHQQSNIFHMQYGIISIKQFIK